MMINVPQFVLSNTESIPQSDFCKAYNSHQAIHIRGVHAGQTGTSLDSNSIQSLFQSLDEADKASWCIENKSNFEGGDVAPIDFLNANNEHPKGYCSFLVQHSSSAMEDLLSRRLPMVHLPIRPNNSTEEDVDSLVSMKYGPCIWFFFGKNYQSALRNASSKSNESNRQPSEPLLGRPEHTDSISHDGTWHYQLSGKKIWRLRPTAELVNRIRQCNGGDAREDPERNPVPSKKRNISALIDDNTTYEEDNNTRMIEVECEQGDVLLLNTQLWWHSTLIPPQHTPSISYARDVYFLDQSKHSTEDPGKEDQENVVNESRQQQQQQQQSSMTNIDGTYAAKDIEASTILFTEHTMPHCELHRSKTNPNCQVVELEDETTGESYMAVVSTRDIKAGEFFCVMESDSEEDGEEDQEDGEDAWDEEEEEEEEDAIE